MFLIYLYKVCFLSFQHIVLHLGFFSCSNNMQIQSSNIQENFLTGIEFEIRKKQNIEVIPNHSYNAAVEEVIVKISTISTCCFSLKTFLTVSAVANIIIIFFSDLKRHLATRVCLSRASVGLIVLLLQRHCPLWKLQEDLWPKKVKNLSVPDDFLALSPFSLTAVQLLKLHTK